MTPALVRSALVMTLIASAAAAADPVTDQMDAARRAYESGERRVAIQALQFAVTQIEEQITAEQLKVLPDPLPGWSAEAPTAQAGGLAAMIAGTNLTRAYRKDDSDAQVRISVTADSPLMSMMSILMSTPMLMQADPGSSAYSYSGFRGLLQNDEAGNTKISLMIGTRIMLQIEGSNGADRAALEAYLGAMDLNALEQALLG